MNRHVERIMSHVGYVHWRDAANEDPDLKLVLFHTWKTYLLGKMNDWDTLSSQSPRDSEEFTRKEKIKYRKRLLVFCQKQQIERGMIKTWNDKIVPEIPKVLENGVSEGMHELLKKLKLVYIKPTQK